MKPFLLLLVLLISTGAAMAQAPPAARPDSLIAVQAAPDTVAAIHRLFARRRLRRNLIATSLGAGALVGAAISASSTHDGGSNSSSGGSFVGAGISFDGSDYLILYAIPAVPLILLDFVIYANYSRKRERWVVEEFVAHRLSTRLRRKLKPRYFQQ